MLRTAIRRHSEPFRRICLGAILLMRVMLVAQSHDDRPPELTETSLEKLGTVQVYSASKHLQSLTEAPAFVTVITADDIRKFGYRTVAELLQSVAGFYVTYDRNYSYIGVRGFSRPGDFNSRVLLLVNGHRMNENIYDGGYIGTEFPIDLDIVSRVEVARGPGSALYGTNAFFAVVNIVTQSPEQHHGIEVEFDAASFNTFSGSLRIGSKIDPGTRWLLSATAYDSAGPSPLYLPAFDSPTTNNGLTYKSDGDNFQSVFLDIDHQPFDVNVFYSNRWKSLPTGEYGTVFGDPRTRTLDRRGYIDLRYSRPLSEDWKLNSRGYFDYYGYKGAYIFAGDAGSTDEENDYARGAWSGGNADVTFMGWRKHSLMFGSEARLNIHQDQGSRIVGDPFPIFLDHRGSNNWAIYMQDEIALARPLTVFLGGRYDRYSQFGGTTNPRAGLVYRPWTNTALKFTAGTAFRAPNSFELYYHGVANQGDPLLRPERVRTMESTVEHTFGDRVRLAGTLFANRISQLIGPVEYGEGTFMFRNSRRISANGVETEIEAKWSTDSRARFSYSFVQTRDEMARSSLTDSPKHLVKMNVTMPVVSRRLFAALEGQYTSGSYSLVGRAGGFGVVNASLLARRLARNLELSFSAYNLFDHKYAELAGDEQAGAVPQDGRTLRLKVTYRF